MDFARDPEQRGELPAHNSPQQEPSIEPTAPAPTPVNRGSRDVAAISDSSSATTARGEHPLPLWLRRVMLFVLVAFAVEIGLFLVIAPWYDGGRLWAENSLLLRYPTLRAFLIQDFIRGVVSGIGVVDIWIGIWEAAHYKEAIHN